MEDDDPIEALNRLLKFRLEEWRLSEKKEKPLPHPVVAITQEPGCRAEKIAEGLCSEFGFHLYDWELLEQIAKDEQVSVQLVSSLEKDPPSGFAEYLADLAPEYSLRRYVSRLKKILLAIAVTGNAVIVGRGSNFFLPSDKKIGLCFVAPLDLRIKNVMKELGLTGTQARKYISKLEAEHRSLVKRYFQADIRDATRYHLVINTALVQPDTIVELVKATIEAVQAEKHDSHY